MTSSRSATVSAASAAQAALTTAAAVHRLAQLYESLSPEMLPQLAQCYASGARFKDPFNDLQGVPAIVRVFEHMFATLERPRFVVTQRIVQGDQAFLVWEFYFRLRHKRWCNEQFIRGATHLQLDAHGLVALHRDYWDAAEELYEKLPALGGLMRWLRRQMATT
ncbi:nuclear transport factor 2 family protein [Simplicispira psychrophila]|uniref:nuclear transport factor 2 family protein n=1 Tax=Simplicispira psychrophila TaxID=80882 RepID=UPI000690CE4B|nr:nuclear transport factor 2 family protein [Simplicispira psychrophila]